MWKRFLSIGTVMIAVIALSVIATGVAKAGSDGLRYQYHLGSTAIGCPDEFPNRVIDPSIAVGPMPSCRPEAAAEDFAGQFPDQGGSIAIRGQGELKIGKNGKPRHVKGSGTYARYDEMEGIIDSGTWKARKLLLFTPYGSTAAHNPNLPPGSEAGRALIQIRLDPDQGKKFDGVLEVGCRLGPLPAGNPGIFGTIEGVRVMVQDGLNYNLPADPKATLFINLGEK